VCSTGHVIVRPGAFGSDAHQVNKNLLLSEQAEAYTRPRLEIFADDVACTHGAAVGHLDEAALFYLRSRGIPLALARTLLVRGFAHDVLQRFPPGPLRDYAEGLVAGRLGTSNGPLRAAGASFLRRLRLGRGLSAMSRPGTSRRPVELRRACPAVLVPSGQRAVLSQGQQVVVVRELGGSFTVEASPGLLMHIDGAEADALGLDTPAGDGELTKNGGFDLDQVTERLRTIFDPEIPVNVVDLGLVYSCEARPLGGGGHRVEIKMSMTAPGCGMGDVLREEARQKVAALSGVAEVDVELVWDPPWHLGRMSEAARLELGLTW
jgi:probable FeS assembly SUF system protein SufT